MQISIFDSRLLCALFKGLIEQRTDYAFFTASLRAFPGKKIFAVELPALRSSPFHYSAGVRRAYSRTYPAYHRGPERLFLYAPA